MLTGASLARKRSHKFRIRVFALLATVCIAGTVLTGCQDATPSPQSQVGQDWSTSEALVALASLPTKGRAPKSGYDREAFAYRSFDFDRNGCDARNDILRRDLREVTFQLGNSHCVVVTGVLDDPYSGKTIDFVRGEATSADVQIDHVVALSDAWQKGAQSWTREKMQRFGNDPLNLLAVDGPLNNQKGDGDAATWLPPNRSYRCQYVARQITVKKEYALWVTQAERDSMEKVLGSCPDQELAADLTAQSPTAPYKNCAEARAAGAAPVYRTDPGYGSHLDGDGDGVGCE